MSQPLRHLRASASVSREGNLGTTERWVSAAAGLSLALSALGTRTLLGRIALGAAGVSLLARGATGFCAVKSALRGETNWSGGLREQARRLQTAVARGTTPALESMDELYAVELQELHSAERQLAKSLTQLGRTLRSEALALRFDEYATELDARRTDLESLLARREIDARPHPDDAIRALLGETEKMSAVRTPALRDAALVASIQRIIHYKIAGYGAIASYAKVLDRTEEAVHFAELADRDKTVDTEFSRLAKNALNPDAAKSSPEQTVAPGSLRTH